MQDVITLDALIGSCSHGVYEFKVFCNGEAVAVITKESDAICNILASLEVDSYNIQIINNRIVMFIYCVE